MKNLNCYHQLGGEERGGGIFYNGVITDKTNYQLIGHASILIGTTNAFKVSQATLAWSGPSWSQGKQEGSHHNISNELDGVGPVDNRPSAD